MKKSEKLLKKGLTAEEGRDRITPALERSGVTPERASVLFSPERGYGPESSKDEGKDLDRRRGCSARSGNFENPTVQHLKLNEFTK